MPEAEAEYLKNVELGGVGKRVFTNVRLRLLKYGTVLPSYNNLVQYEDTIKYQIIEYMGGWRGKLPDIMQVI